MKSIATNLEFTCSNNKCEASTNKLDFKGEVREGKVKLFNDGKVSICIENETYAAYKNAATDEVTVAKGTCNYSGDEYTVDELVSLSDFNDMKAQYEAQISTLEEQLENSSKTDLLWTNPNPNAEFAAQTVSLDLTNYSKIVVYAQNVTYPTLYQKAYYVLDKNNT